MGCCRGGSATLPRLGSRVRIPSPAPNFLKEINDFERSFGPVCRFPAPDVRAGEAWGKHQKAQSSMLSTTFGMVGAVVARSPVRTKVCDGATAELQERASPHACLLTWIPMRTTFSFPSSFLGSLRRVRSDIIAQYPGLLCASAARAEASWVSALTHAPRRSQRHLVQRVDGPSRTRPCVGAVEKPAQCIQQEHLANPVLRNTRFGILSKGLQSSLCSPVFR